MSQQFSFIEPTATQPFLQSVSLDGSIYTLQVRWNIYANRYYIHVYDQGNSLALCTPMVSGGTAYPINLSGRAFNTPIYYNSDTQQFQVGA